MCIKQKFGSFQEADDMRKRIEERSRRQNRPCHVARIYKCRECGNYHFTSQPERNQRLRGREKPRPKMRVRGWV